VSNASNAPSPSRVLGDENRLRVLAAVVLGESPTGRIAQRTSLTDAATRFEPNREREVNAVLEEVHDDYVTLRRYLVDEGLLERNAVYIGARIPRPLSDAAYTQPAGR
jgi:hypothetical protein